MTGKELPGTSPYAGDDGSTPPELAAALATVAADGAAAGLADVVQALGRVRVLVPVMSQAEVVEEVAGLAVDREASTGVVAISAPDGRQVLPVFSSVEAMARWRTDARPVPVQGRQAAASAVNDGWELLVVDPGGPAVQVPRTAVWALANGQAWRPAVAPGADGELVVDTEVAQVLCAAALVVPGVRQAEALPGQRSEVALRLGIDKGLDRAGLDAVLAQVNARLAAATLVAERVDSLEMRIHGA